MPSKPNKRTSKPRAAKVASARSAEAKESAALRSKRLALVGQSIQREELRAGRSVTVVEGDRVVTIMPSGEKKTLRTIVKGRFEVPAGVRVYRR